MTNLEKRIKKYIKDNPDVRFDLYLKEQLKDKEFKKLYEQERMKTEIAIEIYRLRKKQKMTQAQLAKNIKMPQANIARIEQAQHLPTLITLAKIFDALGQTVNINLGQKSIRLR